MHEVAIVSRLIDGLVKATVQGDVQHVVAFGGPELLLQW